MLLSHFPSPTCRWRRAPELGRANVSCPQSTHLSQRHYPYTQVLSHLLRQWERRQATVPALLSEADPAHRVSAAQDLPSSHQDRLHKPQPSALLAPRHSAGGSQLSDWRWGQCGEMCHSKFSNFLVSLRRWRHLCKIRAVYLLLCPLFISFSFASPSASNGSLPIWNQSLHTVLQAFWDTVQLCRNSRSVFGAFFGIILK